MENQHDLGTASVGVNVLQPHAAEDKSNRHQPQRVSRFSIQRLDTADIAGMMPRRRASVNHGQQPPGSRSEFIASSFVTMDDINISKQHAHPTSGRGGSLRETIKGLIH